ncbi:MAG: hypothetical protein HY863_08315 [Chloroflexi bacterium]|nr:hypothetical protein [Chloroflexota bacterium]
MTTQNENANYDFQSFDDHPTAPMFPAGWDLSALPSTPTIEPAQEVDDSSES